MATLKEVFVPGGMPSYTYQERKDSNDEDKDVDLEKKLRSATNRLRKFISVAGPTKSGKTVLIRKVFPKESSVWVEGAHISSVIDFWNEVHSKLGLSTPSSLAEGKGKEETREFEGSIGIKPGGIGSEIKDKQVHKGNRSLLEVKEFATSVAHLGLEGLLRSNRILIIDDFHYVSPDVQTSIVRGLKQAVFDGLTVILILIPHRMHQAATAEMDVDGRTHTLKIPEWSRSELFAIAESGFRALNVLVNAVTINEMVVECFQSPHLMQDLCSLMCDDWGVMDTQTGHQRTLKFTKGKDKFFKRFATDAVNPNTFKALQKGPDRSNRISRPLKAGGTCDTYEAVLMALRALDVMSPVKWSDLRKGLQEVLIEEPQQQEVTRVLEKMDEIAKERDGEPVIDYVKEQGELHLVDPFFRFYVRWGS